MCCGFDTTWRSALSALLVYVMLLPIVLAIAKLLVLPVEDVLVFQVPAMLCILAAFPAAVFLGKRGPVVGSILPLLMLSFILISLERTEPRFADPLELQLTGKRALVIGGTRGVGRALVDALHARGAHVSYTYRREEDARRAERLRPLRLELSDLDAVARFARDYEGTVDIFVGNAAQLSSKRTVASGEHELLVVNYLSQASIALQLLESESPPSAMLMVSSESHQWYHLFEDELWDWTAPFQRHAEIVQTLFSAYPRSKRLQVMFADEVARRFPGVRAHSTTPGPTNSHMMKQHIDRVIPYVYPGFVVPLVRSWARLVTDVILRQPTSVVRQLLFGVWEDAPLERRGCFYYGPSCREAVGSAEERARVFDETRKWWQKSVKQR